MSVLKITKENFRQEVLNAEGKLLLDFWASWCGPCRMVSPILDQIARENPSLKIGKINVDEEPELASMFRIASIPTLVVMEGGKIAAQAVGVRPKEQILDMLE